MSKSAFMFTIEQWEFIRRLRNSGVTKEHICQAFSDLDRIENELGNIFHNSSSTTNESLVNLLQNKTNADANSFSKNFQLFMAKNIAALNFHQRFIQNASIATTSTETSASSPVVTKLDLSPNSNSCTSQNTSPLSSNNDNNSFDIEDEIKELEELKS